MSTLSKNARKQTVRMIRYRPLWFVSQRKFLSTPCQTTWGIHLYYSLSLQHLGNTKMRLKKEIGKNTEITVATDDGVYHLLPNRIDFNNNP